MLTVRSCCKGEAVGRGRVFRNGEITPDNLLASACLPAFFKAAEIDGEHYWDGGYAGNPTITPLVRMTAYPVSACGPRLRHWRYQLRTWPPG
jgi:predicted acylesterase/phospholipase RssA